MAQKHLAPCFADPEWLGILRAVCADPLSVNVRLIAADWLDGHGEQDRAHFIRESISNPDLGFGCESPEKCDPAGSRVLPDGTFTSHLCGTCEGAARFGLPRRLLSDGTPAAVSAYTGACGFVYRVKFTTPHRFLLSSPDLFVHNPITRIEYSLARPNVVSEFARGFRYVWTVGNTNDSDLPKPIHAHLPPFSFRSPEEARHALSHASVSYGRTRSGLPPLAFSRNGSPPG